MKYGPNLTARHLAGSLDRFVKQAARDTLVANMDADREGNPRWARIPDGEACDFCEMLGSRGFVYHSERSAGADNPWHPHCNCQIAVSFDPAIDMYWKGGTHVSRGYGMEDAELAVPGRDGSYELRDVDIDELFERYLESGRAYSSPKSRVFKRFAEGSFMNDPIAYLMESATVDELEARAADVLAEYKRVFSDEQLAKYLPSARNAAQKRMRELKESRRTQLMRIYTPTARAAPVPEINVKFDSVQMGRKIGKHARDFGLDPAKLEDRELMETIIDGIIRWPDEVVSGEWMDQPNPCRFFIREHDVVVVNANNEFVTVLKDGIERNTRVKRARNMV